MKFRSWVNIITLVLLVLVVYFGWGETVKAWGLLGQANLWILMLLIPLQFASYFAAGESMFSYFRYKGDLVNMSRYKMTRIALELNFVNHIIPVPSIAGFTYLNWLLRRYDVGAGRSTMAQIIRLSMSFVSLVIYVIIAVLYLIFDQGTSRLIVIVGASFVVAAIVGIVTLIYFIGNHKRLLLFSRWITDATNKFMRICTFGRKKQVLKLKNIESFFIELHQDYLEIRKDKKVLVKPFMWSLLAIALDITMFMVAFLSLGSVLNPATFTIAFALCSMVAIFAATPGGTGAYEAVMIAFLASAGVSAEVAIAGTILARAILFSGTIIFGYLFYQLTINKYGKITNSTDL